MTGMSGTTRVRWCVSSTGSTRGGAAFLTSVAGLAPSCGLCATAAGMSRAPTWWSPAGPARPAPGYGRASCRRLSSATRATTSFGSIMCSSTRETRSSSCVGRVSSLRLSGILLVGVPNLAGLTPQLKSWQSRLGLKSKPWRHYAALHHLWFFTPASLRRLAEAAAFEVVQWETPVMESPGPVRRPDMCLSRPPRALPRRQPAGPLRSCAVIPDRPRGASDFSFRPQALAATG